MVIAEVLKSVHYCHHTLLNYTKQTELIGPLWGGEQEYIVVYLIKTYFCISVNALQNTANTEIKFTLNITRYFFLVNVVSLHCMHIL